MEYRREFSKEARDRVEREIILAHRAISHARATLPVSTESYRTSASEAFTQEFLVWCV